MKKKIAKLLHNVASKLECGQIVDIAIAKQFEYPKISDDIQECDKDKIINDVHNQVREWIRKCIVMGVDKATTQGVINWTDKLNAHGGVFEARLRIICPKKIIKHKQHENN